MGILFDTLTADAERRARIVRDAERVLDAEVSGKAGIGGLAVKATFKVVKGLQPGFIPSAVDDLLEDFVRNLEPHWETWRTSKEGTCAEYFVTHSSEVADSLLSVTDGRAESTRHNTLKKAYLKLRPKGKEHVVASMPRVGAMIEKNTADLV